MSDDAPKVLRGGGNAGQDPERMNQTVVREGSNTASDEDGETMPSQQSPFATSQPGVMAEQVRRGDPLIGTHVSGYVVKGRLGSGGMGIVYEGEQPVIGKRVAIKVLRPEIADNPDVVQRLVAEARAVNQVGHRGIIDVFGFGELPDGRQCIVMEYLDGESLDSVLAVYRKEHRVMPVGDVLIILDEMLSALAAAHSAGVIHRDLKPSNIFLCRQRDGTRYVKVLDFGIAKLGVLGAPTPQTRASMMVGTPSYMAPEQARGGLVGPAMDLYAVGVMAFEMLTGQQPFNAESVVEMLLKHQNEAPPRPSSVVMSIPDAVDELVLKLLEKKPEHRPASSDAVRDEVLVLKKELVDPTGKRAALEVNVSLRPKTGSSPSLPKAKTGANPPVTSSSSSVQVSPVASVPEDEHKEGLSSTAIVSRERPKQTRGQVAPTAPDLPAARELPTAEADEEPLVVPRSNRPLIIGLATLAIGALVLGVVVLRPSKADPDVVVVADPKPPEAKPSEVKPPEPVDVKPVEVKPADPKPPDVKPPEPVVAKPVEPKPVEQPVVVAKPMEPKPIEKPVVVAKPVEPKPVEKPVVVAKPVEPKPVEPKPAVATTKAGKNGALLARLKKLDERISKAAADGNNMTLYQKQTAKLRDALSSPTLSEDTRDQVESTINRLEGSSEF